ncbi:MAG: malonate decarboxylase synthase [Burkholderia sp.]|jgi:phosphoribosyl-dephospho-CoA transferase|nr:malonate decarboxylase synthase [Burkholderia sp.]
MPTLQRHKLAWLSPQGWRQALAFAPEHAQALQSWRREDWPLVARRRDPNAAAGEVSLGLPLPPCPVKGKVRIALRLPAGAVLRSSEALALASVLPALPPRWQAAAAALAAQAAAQRIVLRVYGSAAWQALTGLHYLGPRSDIDLLFYPDSVAALQAGAALFQKHANHLPLDGEIVFPPGRAVAFKEWLLALEGGEGMRVMVKDDAGVSLQRMDALADALPAAGRR